MSDSYCEVAAKIEGNPEVVDCFDPTIVVLRLNESFPDVLIDLRDYAWREYDYFKQRGEVEGATRVAENDASRRGPIWGFRIPSGNGEPVAGHAERYAVSIGGQQSIPDALKVRFLAFLNTLRFAPFVRVSSVKIEGNDEIPA